MSDTPAEENPRHERSERRRQTGRPARDGGSERRPRSAGSGDGRGSRSGGASRDRNAASGGAWRGARDGEARDGGRGRGADRAGGQPSGGQRSYGERAGGQRPYRERSEGQRSQGRRSQGEQAGGQRSYGERSGNQQSYSDRSGGQRPYGERSDGGRSGGERSGGARSYGERSGGTGFRRDRGGASTGRRDDRPQGGYRGDRSAARGERRGGFRHDGEQRSGRDGKLWTRDGRPARGDRDARDEIRRDDEQAQRSRELQSVRPRHDDPIIPDEVQARELPGEARVELKTLSKDNADWVAKHLVMAGRLIEEDPELAHKHALSASRRAGRVAVVRETLAITAYATGDFALALRELRTYRRISGSNDQLPLMVDSERGVGRPDRALELGRSVDRTTLPNDVQVSLAIAMSGARLDLGQPEAALAELEIPQLDPNRAFSYSADLFHAYAEVLEELGRDEQAAEWRERAARAEAALEQSQAVDEHETIHIIEEDILLGNGASDEPHVDSDDTANDGEDDVHDAAVSPEQ